MNVKGIAFLAREQMMIAAHGEAAWRAFFADFAKREPALAQHVLPVSKIPADAFLRFNDALTRHFYGGDERAYWRYGEQSAAYALTRGQLKGLFKPGESQKFLHFTPAIWKGYFDEGELTATPHGSDAVDLRISGVPIQHVYFEYSVIGFGKGGMEVLQAARPQPECIRGFSRKDPDVLYRFFLR